MSLGTKDNAGKLSYTELGSFFENMAMMVKSGISVPEAASLLMEEADPADRVMSGALSKICEELSMGMPLGDAMKASEAFPDYAVDMITSAEHTGRIEKTLFHLSAYGYINVPFTLCKVMLVIMIVLVILMLAGISMWKNGKKETVKRVLSKSALFRDLFDNLDLYRFSSCFEMFLSSGEHQDEALVKSMPVVQTEALRSLLQRCKEKMDGGMSFSQTAYEEHLYDQTNNRMLIPAERSGMLDAIMQKILSNLKVSIEKSIGRIANTVEPLLTGVLMIFIGIMLISLMVPLIGIMNSIG